MRHQNFPLQNVLLQYTYCVLTLLIENPLKDFKIPVTYAIVTNKLLCTLVCKHKKFKDTSKEWKGVRNRETGKLERGKAENFIATSAGRQLLLLATRWATQTRKLIPVSPSVNSVSLIALHCAGIIYPAR